MAGIITYALTDFGLQSLVDRGPRVLFEPSSAATKGARIFPSTPIESIPDATGRGVVTLESTDGVVPKIHYTVSIEHLHPGGQYTHYDLLNLQLYVPEDYYGSIADLPGAPLSANTVLVSLDPPPAGYKGWYLNAPGPGNPLGDPNDPASSGTGILEIVS